VTDWGGLTTPFGIAVSASGYVYIANAGSNTIVEYNSGGTLQRTWGEGGTGKGDFEDPYGLGVGPTGVGNVYVADTDNNRIQMFSPSGGWDQGWGQETLNFINPWDVAVNPSTGNWYVADSGNNRIDMFNKLGYFQTDWTGTLNFPEAVAISPATNNVYVADTYNNQIQEFTPTGSFITKWGSKGSGPGQFEFSEGIAVDPNGYVYVTDWLNDNLQMFTSSGTYLTQVGSKGSGPGQFNSPEKLALMSTSSSSGYIYVADSGNNRVEIFSYKDPPAVTSISPASGPITGETSVTISGSAFTGATSVYFGSTQAGSFTVNSDSSITATSPATGIAGTVDITVTTPGGTSATSSTDRFTYTPAPITGIGAITGTPQVGSTLTAGAVSPSGATVTYQWYRYTSGVGEFVISGATSNTYTPVNGDVGWDLLVIATGSGSYTGTATSAPIGPVETKTPITGIGAITGTPQVGSTLTAGAVSPSGATVTYQWQESATIGGEYIVISGDTSSTYTPVASDGGAYIEVVAIGSGGCTGRVTSAPVGPVLIPLTGIGAITGTPQVGSTLTAGAVSPSGATVTYQWQESASSGGTYTAISGATSSTYAPVNGDIGQYIEVVATGTGSYTGTATSTPVGPITASGLGKDEIGASNGEYWYLDVNGNGYWTAGDQYDNFGAPGWTPVVGDWNGQGKDEIGASNGEYWYLDTNGLGYWTAGDQYDNFGVAGWTPVVGDWNGQGKDEIGASNGEYWYLDVNGNGYWTAGDQYDNFGAPGWTPVVGDWNGQGKTEIGASNGEYWYLDVNGNGYWTAGDQYDNFGVVGWTPVVGDWNGQGKDEIGASNGEYWYLDVNGNGYWTAGDQYDNFGVAGWTPVVGDWNGQGKTEIGASNGEYWYLDTNGLGYWTAGDQYDNFGVVGWKPIVGDWS
jgi:DNA-binding beta-propeller fold protein YncE